MIVCSLKIWVGLKKAAKRGRRTCGEKLEEGNQFPGHV